LGREGEIGQIRVGAVGDVTVWSLTGPLFAGAVADPIEAWLRCGPSRAKHTVINGKVVVRDGEITHKDLEPMVRRHNEISRRIQKIS
jgi:cytosine/adenosine deaminase-related metal-dependent hydrolase